MNNNTLYDFKPNDKVQIIFFTDVKLKGGQKNPNQGKLRKLSVVFATLTGQTTYKDRVSHQMFVEGKADVSDTYQPKERPWGVRKGDSPIIEHNGETYLEFIVEKQVQTCYILDGQTVDNPESVVEGFPEPRSHNEESQGGVDSKINLRCVKSSNILTIIEAVDLDIEEYK